MRTPRHSNLGRGSMVFVLVCALLANGCHTFVRVNLAAASAGTSSGTPALGGLKPGQDVRITLRGGRAMKFAVDAVEPDAIVSADGRRFLAQDIVSIEKRQLSAGRSIALGVGITLVVLVAAVAATNPLGSLNIRFD